MYRVPPHFIKDTESSAACVASALRQVVLGIPDRLPLVVDLLVLGV